MAEKAKSSQSKRKERGLNVRVVQENKTEKDSIRVNNNFEAKSKKKTTAKKTTAKKTAKKTTAKKATVKKTTAKKATTKKATAKKTTVEKTIPKKLEEPKKELKKAAEPVKELKKPASFSKSVKVLKEQKAPEKAPEVILPEQTQEAETESFETLNLGANLGGYESKIILRDVARNRAEVENQPAKIAPKKSEEATKRKRFGIDTFKASKQKPRKLSAKEVKENEIKRAISLAEKLPDTGKKRHKKGDLITRFGWARLTLMITCAVTAVFALVYFVNLTSADMSLKVAASQSGIEATYPDYVPRGYELSDVTSASGKVTMNFKSEEGSFMITEEASSWDSSALLNNYVRENYSDDEYGVVIEQGLTIYMGSNWEAWVNGGLLYKLQVKTGSLTKKQLKTIATSL